MTQQFRDNLSAPYANTDMITIPIYSPTLPMCSPAPPTLGFKHVNISMERLLKAATEVSLKAQFPQKEAESTSPPTPTRNICSKCK